MPAPSVKSRPLPQQVRAREAYAKVPTKRKDDDPARYSKTPHEYGDVLIAGGKLGGPLQRDLLYWIERYTFGTNTSRKPNVITRPEYAKLSLGALAKLCQVWDEKKGKLQPVERKSVAVALADLEARGIIQPRERKGCGKTTAKMYKLTPERWKAAPPYKPPSPKELAAAELAAAEEEAEETAPVCNSCGQQLSEFAGPAKGERGFICQNPGCDMEGIELEFLPAEPAEPESIVNPGKVSRPQPVAVTLAKNTPAVIVRLSYCPQGFDHPVTFRCRSGRNGRLQITATPHHPEDARNCSRTQLQSFAKRSPSNSRQTEEKKRFSEYSDAITEFVARFWAIEADETLINEVFARAGNAPLGHFAHRVNLKLRNRRDVGKHKPALLKNLADDALKDWTKECARNEALAARQTIPAGPGIDNDPAAPEEHWWETSDMNPKNRRPK